MLPYPLIYPQMTQMTQMEDKAFTQAERALSEQYRVKTRVAVPPSSSRHEVLEPAAAARRQGGNGWGAAVQRHCVLRGGKFNQQAALALALCAGTCGDRPEPQPPSGAAVLRQLPALELEQASLLFQHAAQDSRSAVNRKYFSVAGAADTA